MRSLRHAALCSWVLVGEWLAGGCIADDGVRVGPSPESAVPAAPAEVTAAGDGFRELIAVDWELAPGTEQYLCARLTVAEDMFLDGIRPYSPSGTHHVALSVGDKPDRPDGLNECGAAEVRPRTLGGGGVGTKDRILPDGIALELQAGQQVLLNLHLFNPTDQVLRGHSGAAIRPIEASEVRVLADGVLVGPTQLEVPPGRSTSTGRCTLDRPATFFGVLPHMHQTGVAIRVVARSRAHGEVVLYDGPYDFDNQINYPFDMLALDTGDTVEVACTYENTTDRTLHWGESSTQEMCQAGLSRIPAGGASVCNR